MWPEGMLAAWNNGRERQKIAFSCQCKRRVKVSGGKGEKHFVVPRLVFNHHCMLCDKVQMRDVGRLWKPCGAGGE